MNNNELQHHGIKGMRWGVRRSEAQLARLRGGSSAKKTAQPAAKQEPEKKAASTPAKKSSGDMTNAELKARVERIKLEKELAQLTAKQKSAGRKFIEDVLVNSGKAALTAFATKKMTEFLAGAFAAKDGTSTNNKENNSSGQSKPSGSSAQNESTSGSRSSGSKSSTSKGLAKTTGVDPSSAYYIDYDKVFGR